MHYLVLADDLTGACDSAVHFRLRGASTSVHLDGAAEPDCSAQVHSFNTQTRGLDQQETEIRIRNVAAKTALLRSGPHLIFKKIDSLLRGNPGQEIRMALDAFACEFAVITPAFPDMGRSVSSGRLHVSADPDWKPVTVRDLLCSQGLEDCLHALPRELPRTLRTGARYISVDATCTSDLQTIAMAALRSERRVLWAGSGGLASALANTLLGEEEQPVPRQRSPQPVLFCIGSIEAVTARQLEALEQKRAGQFVMVPASWGMSATSLRSILEEKRDKVAAILLSGGDTAAHVCRALDVHSISLEGEVIRGVPWGLLRGGPLDGLAIVTKSGAFGKPDALIQVADYFTCPPT